MSALPSACIEVQPPKNGINFLQVADRSAHDWYRFVLSFPPHLVRTYIDEFSLPKGATILDPFCGTGTTLVEAKKQGFVGIGLEVSPVAHFASTVKLDWSLDSNTLRENALETANRAQTRIECHRGPYYCLDESKMALLLLNSISPLPLHKSLVLLEEIRRTSNTNSEKHLLIALAKVLVTQISNLQFGPEVGVGKPKADADVVTIWLAQVEAMAADLAILGSLEGTGDGQVFNQDARTPSVAIGEASVDAVITSPPYPNEKDYSRATRLESVLLGFLTSKAELRDVKKNLMRSNTKNVYKGDSDDEWVAHHLGIQDLSDTLEAKRIELKKTSGFERLYPKVTKLYFGGMARHLSDLRACLKPGAKLAYVVGDQASYFRVLIRTGEILGEIAEDLGYIVVRRDLFRTRHATATGESLREEVLMLEWPSTS